MSAADDRKNVEAIFPLSPMQASLLFATIRSKGGAADPCFLQLYCTVEGDLDGSRFEQAWQALIDRHEALRTSIHWQAVERPLQVVLKRVQPSWTVEDWRDATRENQHKRLEAYLRRDREAGLDLTRPPVMRLARFHLAPNEWRLVWSCHHTLLDGWSGAIVLSELATFYDALLQGVKPSLGKAPSFREYVTWLQKQDAAAAEAGWRERLNGPTEPTRLPLDGTEATQNGFGPPPQEVQIELSPDASAALHHFARRQRLTLGTLVQGAWAMLLGAHSRQSEVCFGVTVSGRSSPVPGIDTMVGLLTNVLPLRVEVAADLPVQTVLEQLQLQQAWLRRMEHVSLVQIHGWSEMRGSARLFESLVVVENLPATSTPATASIRIGPPSGGITSTYPLTLVAAPGDPFRLHLLYDPARIPTEGARALLLELREILHIISTSNAARVADVLRSIQPTPSLLATSVPARASKPGAPRDALELRLVQIWEQVLGIRSIGIHDDFFALGGHSLTAARLFEAIERALGKRLPLATLFSATTISAMAEHVRGADPSARWSSLVPMQLSGSVPPLFCVHSYEGHLLFYRDLARRLAFDQPAFGLQSLGLDGAVAPLTSIPAMAAHYLEEIRSVQPEGPYQLLGMCFGIAVVLELAHQMHAQGAEVSKLIILDSGFLTRLPPPAADSHRKSARSVLRRIRRLPRAVRLRATRMVAQLNESGQDRNARLVRDANVRAWFDYQPRPFPGSITLIRSAGYGAGQNWHIETWSELCAGVEQFVVPGDHFSMLQEPDVQQLADQIRACLNRTPVHT